ncbi:hypothetical protein ACLESD_17615 [Pyxidicoccus sp. 3LFB2]
MSKTTRQKQEQEFIKELRERRAFVEGVRALTSRAEALAFAAKGPRQAEPGGQLYTNLGAVLNDHEPRGASDWERQLHAELRERLRAAKSKAG